VGVDARSATHWYKGITIVNRVRVYPDGRVVRCPKSTLAEVTQDRRMRPIGGSVDVNRVEKVIDPRYLGLLERERIMHLHRRPIGRLGVHLSGNEHGRRLDLPCVAGRPGGGSDRGAHGQDVQTAGAGDGDA